MNSKDNNGFYHNSLRKEIVDKVDIVAEISKYVPLNKKGANYIGLCPFHDDKTPSMSVSPQKKVFKCFSCGTAGDVVSFVSKFKNISINQAMRELGKSVGIEFKLTKSEIERQKNDKYYKITKEASSFYNFYLNNIEEAKEAKEYVINRGLSQEVIDRFNIGASGENDELYKVLQSKGYLPVDIIEVNLIKSFGDTYHDVFKNRIIFPLEDLEGNVVGFSGRKYKKDDNNAKYINTTDTVIFKKGNILYNYYRSINKIKEKDCVYLFEGFMDVIAAVRCGVENSVASMGTALTQNQIQAIKRYTNNIVVGYDSDGPGVMATLKAIDMLIQEGFNIKVACIPEGKDPDEYIFNNGSEKLYEVLCEKTINAIDFIYNFNLKYLLKEDVNSVENFKNNIYIAINKFNSLAITEAYLNKLSNEIDIPLDAIKKDFEKYQEAHKVEILKENNNKNNQFMSNSPYGEPPIDEYYGNGYPGILDIPGQVDPSYKGISRSVDLFNKQKNAYVKSEEQLILVSYNERKKCLEIINKIGNNFVDKINREILHHIAEMYQKFERIDADMIFAELGDEESNRLRSILDNAKFSPDEEMIRICIDRVNNWPYVTVANDCLNEKPTKENLDRLAKCKKKTTVFNIKNKNREI